MELKDIIIKRIQSEGPISFRDYMEMCLYYPVLGYYNSASEKIGENGDFYTSPNLTPAFGSTIARQLEEMWHLLGKGEFYLIEYGAGTGILCHDILNYCKTIPEFYNRLRYCIIEKSPAMLYRQKKHLSEKVNWCNSIQELGKINGCIFSNELFDNFPVHQVVMQETLKEVFIDYTNRFEELLLPAGRELLEYMAELKLTWPVGFRTEINLEVPAWLREVGKVLNKGFIITIDYGDQSPNLYAEHRKEGTIICYHKHSVNNNPYLNIGQQDITSHVNFSAICHWGLKNGLACCGFTSQANFLLSLGFKEILRKSLPPGLPVQELVTREAKLSHLLLVDMGLKWKVLIQQKGMRKFSLQGLQMG
jgi:SAM-dependent MidA family methyltransferase